jgi:hypothetical protein
VIITTDKVMRPRDPQDHYPTPLPFVEAALGLLPKSFVPRTMLDPGAGSGVWGMAAWHRWLGVELTGVEVREVPAAFQYDHWYCNNFLLYNWAHRYDLVAGNPPYKHAEAFIRRSLALLAPGGYLVQLLRLAFLEGQARGAGLWRDYPPQTVAVCSKRPSFLTDSNKTDATAYAVFCWQQGWSGTTALQWLEVA